MMHSYGRCRHSDSEVSEAVSSALPCQIAPALSLQSPLSRKRSQTLICNCDSRDPADYWE